jgi:SAM dependent carboxyl methyltransferase
MEGRGVYNASSALQATGGSIGLPLFEEAAAEIAIADDNRPIVLADYGSSEGGNSLTPLRAAIRVLRERFGPERAITAIHIDLPANDFSSLFEVVDGSTDSYLRADNNVFPSAVGRSFFRAVLPPSHVDLGWSSYAAQWLSRVPASIAGQIFAQSANGDLATAFAPQGAADWRAFLALRSKELRPGGRLIVIMPSVDETGLQPTAVLFDCANDVLAEMVAEGSISASERQRMVLGFYLRSPAELLAPFSDRGTFADLRPKHCSVASIGDVAWAQYERDRDPAALARRRAAFFRATFAPQLAHALEGASETAARNAFVERLEAGVRQRILNHLTPRPAYVATISLEKVGDAHGS